MRVSLRDVAQRAGVSINTASGVLNARSGASRISEATRERVRRVADELGYHPNHLAGSLRSGKTSTLGMMLSSLSNPYFLSILQTTEKLAAEAGYHVLVDAVTSDGPNAGDSGLLRGWPVDGVLLCTKDEHDVRTLLGPQADGLPVVYLGYGGDFGGEASVAFDLRDGARQAMRHLVERGCRRIVYVTPYDLPNHPGRKLPDLRYLAYVDFCRELGREPEIILLDKKIDPREAGLAAGAEIAARSPSQRPDGVICHNDMVAIGVYRGLRRAGVAIPEEIRLTGFDNIPDIQYMETPLTTVETPVAELCDAALKLLLARIDGTAEKPLLPVLIPTRLIPGGSS